jgi:surface polysaccharide O-acyltransferase-like enzyme
VLRAIAISGVVFIHASSASFIGEKFSVNYDFGIILRQIANFSVPLFLFISGFFMSGKLITTRTEYLGFIQKQIPRVLLPFIVWSCIYSFFAFIKHTDIKTIIIEFITFQASVPFYFILLIIQYYLLQPFILRLATKKRFVVLSLIISLSFCSVFELLRIKYNINFPIIIYAGIFPTWLIFPVLGAYVSKHQMKISTTVLLIGTIVFLLLSILHSFYSIFYFDNPTEAVMAVKVSSFMYSLFMCLFLFKVKEKLNVNTDNILCKIGLLSFGVYFSHMLFLTVIRMVTNKFLPNDLTSNVLFLLGISALTVILSYVFGKLLHKINPNIAKVYFGY